MEIEHRDRLLVVELGGVHRCLSSAMWRGGLVTAARVAWVEVRNAELPVGLDPFALMHQRLEAGGVAEAVGLMTSRPLRHFLTNAGRAASGAAAVDVLATVGLSNALRIGDPPGFIGAPPGTINILARVSAPLTDAALVEAVSLVAEARTAAVREADWPSRRTGRPSTGTGTDAIIVAAPVEGAALPWCGKHTDLGSALGAAVLEVVAAGVDDWLEQQGGKVR